jgi:hypothetical protein
MAEDHVIGFFLGRNKDQNLAALAPQVMEPVSPQPRKSDGLRTECRKLLIEKYSAIAYGGADDR